MSNTLTIFVSLDVALTIFILKFNFKYKIKTNMAYYLGQNLYVTLILTLFYSSHKFVVTHFSIIYFLIEDFFLYIDNYISGENFL